jgi:hypothetical protein
VRRLFLIGTVAVCVASTIAGAQQQRWADLYDEAVRHVQRQEWADAERKLIEAKRVGPASAMSVLRYGSLRPPYFPEFYLGIVYLSTGRPQQALEQFQLAKKAGIDARRQPFRELDALEGRARDLTLAAENAAKGELPKPGGATPDRTVAEKLPEPKLPEPPPPPNPAVPSRNYAQEVSDLLGSARALLAKQNYDAAEKAAASARVIAGAQKLASAAQADTLVREIRGRRAGARVEDALSRRDAAAARRELNALVTDAPEFASAALRSRVGDLEREVRAAQLQRDAMRAFYSGSYQQSLGLLEELEKLAPSARAHFYRACTLAALAAATPRPTEDRRLADARRSYTLAARDAAQFRQDLRYISPKVRELLGIR